MTDRNVSSPPTDRLGRLQVDRIEPLGAATKVTASFDHLDVRSRIQRASAAIFLPDRQWPLPLYYQAGYEIPDADLLPMVELGFAVVNPRTPVGAWPGTNLAGRSINLDVALLHIARSLSCVDDSKVVLAGGSEAGWAAWMLAAETFPLAAVIPDAAILNRGYVAWRCAQVLGSVDDPDEVPALAALSSAIDLSKMLLGADPRSATWLAHSAVSHAAAVTCDIHALHSTSDLISPVEQIARSLRRDGAGVTAARGPADPAWLALEDVIPDLHIEIVRPPTDAPPIVIETDRLMRRMHDAPVVHDRLDRSPRAVLNLPAPPFRVVICVVDDGGPRADGGHFRHSLDCRRGAFLFRVLRQPRAIDLQFSETKREVLLARLRGESWIGSSIPHLDFPEAEVADVERALAHLD